MLLRRKDVFYLRAILIPFSAGHTVRAIPAEKVSDMTEYTTASGVVYNITEPDSSWPIPIDNVWDVTITAPDGTTIYTGTKLNPGIDVAGVLQLAASGYVLTGTEDYTTLVSAASAQTIVTAPGSTGSIIIGVGAAEANTYYIGGDNTISGLVSAIAGTTVNVVGGTATLSGNTGGSLVGLLTGSTVNIEYGGTFNTGAALASVLEGGTVNFGTGGGTLILNGGGTLISLLASGTLSATTINNYDPSKDTIELQGTTDAIIAYTIVDNGSGSKIITMLDSSDQPVAEYSVNTASGVTLTDGAYAVASANNPLQVTYSDGNTYIGACFLSGSMISTPDGDVAVEDIKIGDEIIAFDWKSGRNITRPVIWAGKTHVNVRHGVSDDMSGYPIRVLKDAIADGVPYKDMLITAEHSLFFDGKFVPARMLVNGRSIFYDKSITSYDYYHIETEQHSVITADGMLTESYLDTGNRHTFRQTGNVVAFTPSRNLTWDDAAAPLGVSREFAEPLFRQVETRAEQAGIVCQDAAPVLTEAADLHLETDNGMVIRPAREANDRIVFMIPTGVKSVRIVSNASRPSDVIGPFVDDRRYFGVAVGEIMMFESNRTHNLKVHLTEKELDGWNTLEWEDTRWTAGNALLPLGERHPNSSALIAIQIKKTGPYLLADTTTADLAITA